MFRSPCKCAFAQPTVTLVDSACRCVEFLASSRFSPGIIKLLCKGNTAKSLWQPKTGLRMLKAFVRPQAFSGHSALPSKRKLCVSLVVPGLLLATEAMLQNTLKDKVPHKTELYGVFSPWIAYGLCLYPTLVSGSALQWVHYAWV